MIWWMYSKREKAEAGPSFMADYVWKLLQSAEENGCIGEPDNGESGPVEEEG